MAFTLNSVVPWGRNLKEYQAMFMLDEKDFCKKIAGFGDGPASFNYEAHCLGYDVTSYDSIYQFGKRELEQRINDVRDIVMQQMSENVNNYIWTDIKSLEELEDRRMSAMKLFLEDFELGKAQARYIFHALPEKLPVADNSYDIGLSSHFLLMYTSLGYDFHIQAMTEMLRVCKEIRVFPIVDLDAKQTDLISAVIDYFKAKYPLKIIDTVYCFQKGTNKCLTIRK